MTRRSNLRLVTTSLPTHGQLTVIFTIVVVLIVALVITAPYASRPTSGSESFLPAYAGAVCVIEITTAALLLATYRVQRSAAVLVLSFGYLLSGALLPFWALTFPGVFPSFGWNSDLQATAWIAAVRRIGFALSVLGFAVCDPGWTIQQPARWLCLTIVAVGACILATLWFALGGAEGLPSLMTDARTPARPWRHVSETSVLLYAFGIVALLRRRDSALDIWMSVVLLSLLGEILLLSYWAAGVRLSVGWWAGRVIGLIAAAIILLVLLTETAANYVKLADAAASELRSRRNRLTSMEALSASIAHEINQPLASIVTGAGAGLRWLSQDPPDLDRARGALSRIADDGHRAGRVVSTVRTMFLKGAPEREPVDLRCVITDALSHCQSEHSPRPVATECSFPAEAIHVDCNAVQMLHVCINLIENAMDSLDDVPAASGRLTIRIRRSGPSEVEARFIDNGSGVAADMAERIFEPFASSKPDGMGMGLMFCRTVIEAHGGRLWYSPNTPTGACFAFTLPSSRSLHKGAGGRADV